MSFVPPEKPPELLPDVQPEPASDRAMPAASPLPRRASKRFAAMVIVAAAIVSGGIGSGVALVGEVLHAVTRPVDPYDKYYVDDDYEPAEPEPGPTDDIDFTGYGPEQPLLTGAPSSPTAVTPTVCDWECFGYFALMAPSPSTIELENNGLVGTEEDTYGYYSVNEAHGLALDKWDGLGAAPKACLVTSPITSITLDIQGEATPDRDVISVDAGHFDKDRTTTFVQSNRVFATSLLAESYMAQLDHEIRGCTSFSSDEGVSTVSLAPALEVPDSIGSVGWVVSSVGIRTYVFDLQRGNIVERTVLTSRQGMSEADFRAIVIGVATRMDTVHFDVPEP